MNGEGICPLCLTKRVVEMFTTAGMTAFTTGTKLGGVPAMAGMLEDSAEALFACGTQSIRDVRTIPANIPVIRNTPAKIPILNERPSINICFFLSTRGLILYVHGYGKR